MKTNNTDLKTKQIEEATKRLEILQKMGLHENVLSEWKTEQTVHFSEYQKFCGIEVGTLYWLKNEDEFMNRVQAFEQKYNALVYHCTLNYTQFGKLLTLFFVSKYEKEWNRDKEELKQQNPLAYVCNLDDDLCSEFGSILFKLANGGIIRTA